MRCVASILVEQGSKLVIDELEIPSLGVGQVLVRVQVSGVCGAQLGEISGAKGPDPYLPHLLGHEGCGVVDDVGPGVTTVKPGDKVVCHWRPGLGIQASPPKYKWGDKVVGAGLVATFSTMSIISENRLTAVPAHTPPEVAALMGCAATTALGLVSREARVLPGESVVVAGVGGVGLLVVMAARLVGAEPVVALDRQHNKLFLARSLGASSCINTNDLGWVDRVKECVSCGVDVFVDCTGIPSIIAAGYDLITPGGGRLVLVGQPDHQSVLNIPGFRRHYCGKLVMDSQGGLTVPHLDIPRYLRLYYASRLPIEDVITHRFPLEQVNECIAMMMDGETGRCIIEMR